MSADSTPELLCAKEVAQILKKPIKTVYSLPIPQVRIGKRSVRWKRSDLNDFIDDRYNG